MKATLDKRTRSYISQGGNKNEQPIKLGRKIQASVREQKGAPCSPQTLDRKPYPKSPSPTLPEKNHNSKYLKLYKL